MWCERCPDVNDTARLGTDEHPYKAWGILCEHCIMELDIDAGALDAIQRETEGRLADAELPRVTRRRAWRRDVA